MQTDLQILPSPETLADAAAARFVAAAGESTGARGRFVVALSGGTTPRRMYERLAAPALASQVKWSLVHVVWGDERCVPPDHAVSNYRMARETLLDRVPVPPANIHRIRGEDDPTVASAQYETALRALLDTPSGAPRAVSGTCIDLVLLGLGADGHTASIFPGSAAVLEQSRWVTVTDTIGASMRRVTLTAPVINAAAEVLFLVSGDGKASVLKRVLERRGPAPELPAQMIAPQNGRLRWYVDAAAAAAIGD